MKKVKELLSMLCFFSLLIMASCQKNADETEGDRDNLLKSIAEDKDYMEYMQFVHQASYHVAAGSWDKDALTKLMEKYPNLESHCAFPDDELTGIRGGLIWKKTYCAVSSSKKKVRTKFKDQHLSSEDWEKVMAYYHDLKGKEEIQEVRNKILSQNQQLHRKHVVICQ